MKAAINWNGDVIIVSSRHIGIDTPAWGGIKKHHYKVTIAYRGRSFTDDFWSPNAKMSVGGLREALEIFCSDATLGNLTIDEFQSELSCENASELLKAYNGCKNTFENFKSLFIDPYELGDYIREKFNL